MLFCSVLASVSINSFGFELSENEGSELDSCKKKQISLFYTVATYGVTPAT